MGLPTLFAKQATGSCQPEQRKHPAGFSFFCAVGIISIDVARGADARGMNLLNSGSTTLLDDLRRKIDFVVRRPNTGAKLHDQLSRGRSGMFTHLPDRVCDNRSIGAFIDV